MGQFEARFIDDLGNEYRAVKCLISTQTSATSGQYIDLNYALQEGDIYEVWIDFEFKTSSTARSLFGSYNYTNNQRSGYLYKGASKIEFAVGGNALNSNISTSSATNKRIQWHLLADDTNKVRTIYDYGDNSVATSSYTGNISSPDQYLFGVCYVQSSTISAKELVDVKIYRFKAKVNDELIRNMIPVLDSNDVPGLYDLVEKKFYTNQGTGNFTYE